MIRKCWKPFVAALGVVAGLYPGLPAAEPVDLRGFERAHAAFSRSVQGEAGPAAAVEAFRALIDANGDHPLLLAYYGSAETLSGRDAWMPWNRMRHVETGLDAIDRALERLTAAHDAELTRGVPVSIETRLVAARTFLALPKFFNRREQGKRLIADTMASATFATAPEAIRAQYRRLAAEASAGEPVPTPAPGQ